MIPISRTTRNPDRTINIQLYKIPDNLVDSDFHDKLTYLREALGRAIKQSDFNMVNKVEVSHD